MAFRKTIRCGSGLPYFNIGGFDEPKTVSVECGDSVSREELKHISVTDIAETALPMVSLDAVLASGKPIKGDVSFAPSDPTSSLRVESELAQYVDRVSASLDNKQADS